MHDYVYYTVLYKIIIDNTFRKHSNFVSKCTLSRVMATQDNMYKVYQA